MSIAPSLSAAMKPPKGKLPISIVTFVICSFAFIALLYTDSSRSLFKLKSCPRRNAVKQSKDRTAEDNLKNLQMDDRFEFDPEECTVNTGKWMFNKTFKPLYTDRSCPYLDRQVSCVKNGRRDSDYSRWEWQPDDCTLPRFNPELALKKLRGKRLLGDLIQSSEPRLKTLWGSFANGEEGYVELDTTVAYRIGLKTWANWIDSNINPNKTRVFFTTMSPTHTRGEDWNSTQGTKCFNETKPVLKKKYWGTGSDKRMMSVVASIGKKMKVPVTFINITQLSEYRIDAHSSVYTETGGKLLTKEQRADPLQHADCIHWCLPGVPDTWNRIFLAYL
ncbi:hypothetical protein OIU76_020821 [Salix suchowensis]|nr:hypothetical protein OIU76_020821 [Salix suchowensis]